MDGDLFKPPTSHAALDKAAPRFGQRRQRILQLLAERGPSTIFEIAAAMELHDHQISGRFGELERDALIVKTGTRRQKPETGCDAEVYRLANVNEFPARIELPDALNHPTTLKIGDVGLFDRQPFTGHEGLPGVPYARQSHGNVPRLLYRVTLIECDQCGKPVYLHTHGQDKTYRCNTPTCGRAYKLMLVNEPGRAQMLALVATHL